LEIGESAGNQRKPGNAETIRRVRNYLTDRTGIVVEIAFGRLTEPVALEALVRKITLTG
jgi:hypothetical protein